ncbi:hypothetical protein HDV06_001932 [Boothiomyces sp. JEL0866]|nr:hypothetical protein HDV06_001932 [Boothiomyces sp. JEL0866]
MNLLPTLASAVLFSETSAKRNRRFHLKRHHPASILSKADGKIEGSDKGKSRSGISINSNVAAGSSSTTVTADDGTTINVNSNANGGSSVLISDGSKIEIDDDPIQKFPVIPSSTTLAQTTTSKYSTLSITTKTAFTPASSAITTPITTTTSILLQIVSSIPNTKSITANEHQTQIVTTQSPILSTAQTPITVESIDPGKSSQYLRPLLALVFGVIIVSCIVLFYIFYKKSNTVGKVEHQADSTFDTKTLSNEGIYQLEMVEVPEQDLNSLPPTFPVSASTVEALPSSAYQITPLEEMVLPTPLGNEKSKLESKNVESNLAALGPIQKQSKTHVEVSRKSPLSFLALITSRLSKLSFRISRISTPGTCEVQENPFKTKHQSFHSTESEESLSKYLE